jgi:hypothetical protein
MNGMLKLAGLVQKTSRHGTPFLIGYLGDAKVIICENRDRQEGENATHCIYMVAPAQQPPAPPPPPAKPVSRPKRQPAPRRDTRKAPVPPSSRPGWDGLEDDSIGI